MDASIIFVARATRAVMLVGIAALSGCTRAKPTPEPARDAPVATVRQQEAKPEPMPEAGRGIAAGRVRKPAVAGAFYPDDPTELGTLVDGLLAHASARHLRGLRALVCPHAGYRYSGPIAASGYKQLMGLKFEQVVVMAPSHHVLFNGVAVPDVDALATPLGNIHMSEKARALVGKEPFVLDSAPHAHEHALEVQLPFLQRVLGHFEVVPLVFGNVDEELVAQRLNPLVQPNTFFVASSDLSHYYPYEKAVALDRATVDAIVRLDVDALAQGEACGKSPILALVHLARLRKWKTQLLDYRNSGDTVGDRSRVVGYAAIAFLEAQR